MKVCWNAIVKNEAARIERCMLALIEQVSCAVIYDTGSTDDTVTKIEEFFALHRKPCEVVRGTFKNFGDARNVALWHARQSKLDFDYLVLVDADMELRGSIPEKMTLDAYQVMQRSGALVYGNVRLLKRTAKARYIGVTHEYLAVDGTMNNIPANVTHFVDHADGANRPDKFQRDILLLSKSLNEDPNNPRTWFYLAQSHRDAGEFDEALTAYKKRVELGGWDEEVWCSQVNVAHCHKALGDEDAFILNMLAAYNMRPQRAEAAYDLALHYRLKGQNNLSVLFARVAKATPRSNDTLFVNDIAYSVGPDENLSISGFYHPSSREEGFRACDRLALGGHGFIATRDTARANLFHYLPRLLDSVHTYWSKRLSVPTIAGWSALNPSIAKYGSTVYCIVRMVNYVMTPDGRYDIDGKGSDIAAENPIRTRNFLLLLDDSFNPVWTKEIIAPTSDKFPLVLGWEDMRLNLSPTLSVTATVREANEAGCCEQWTGQLMLDDDKVLVAGARRLPKRQDHEKNWMPTPDGRWLHQLGHVISEDGTLDVRRCHVDREHLRGSSQVIEFGNGHLCIIHEANFKPGTSQRVYWHRFVAMDGEYNVTQISPPFVFHDKQIEFCAGMCQLGDGRLAVSFGVTDNSAHIATMTRASVIRILHGEV